MLLGHLGGPSPRCPLTFFVSGEEEVGAECIPSPPKGLRGPCEWILLLVFTGFCSWGEGVGGLRAGTVEWSLYPPTAFPLIALQNGSLVGDLKPKENPSPACGCPSEEAFTDFCLSLYPSFCVNIVPPSQRLRKTSSSAASCPPP